MSNSIQEEGKGAFRSIRANHSIQRQRINNVSFRLDITFLYVLLVVLIFLWDLHLSLPHS